MPHETVDPFARPYPPPLKPTAPFKPPVQWRTNDGDAYWLIDGDLIHPLATMPLGRAQRLLAFLNNQADADLVAAFRDLPLLAAVRRHVDGLTNGER